MKSLKKTAVLYSYLEKHAKSQENFAHFVSSGLVEGADYYLIGPKQKLAETEFNKSDFVKVIDDQEGLAHARVPRFYKEYFKDHDYENLIVISSNMLGPFSRPGSQDNWIYKFTHSLNGDTHLVGSNVIVLPTDHPLARLHNEQAVKMGVVPFISTSAFAITRQGLKLLASKCLFDQTISAREENLLLREIRMSHIIYEKGWNISCLLSKYAEVDFRTIERDPNPTSCLGDPSIDDCYFGERVEQSECIFIKTPNFKNDISYQDCKNVHDVKLYGIFYNDETRSSIPENFIELDNTAGPAMLFESYPIFKKLDEIPFSQSTWLGFFSPRFEEKTKIRSQDIINEINLAEPDLSVILLSSHWKQVAYWPSVWRQGEAYHPGLAKLSQKVADLAGYKIDITKTYSSLKNGVFSNYLVAKADFWAEWKRLVSIYYDLIGQNPELLKFPTPYQGRQVPIHTFVIERFPTMIILELGLKSKFCENLYERSLSHTSVDGSEAIKMDRYKRKFIETGDKSYEILYNYHVEKANERLKRNLIMQGVSRTAS